MSISLPQSAIRNSQSALPLDPRTFDRALSCVHCGLCLPACPTYTTTFHEADSPRGRIQLMRALAEGVIEPTQSVREHLDLCLDCRACETACPSAVVYHELIEETRAKLAPAKKPTAADRLMRWIFFNVFPYPARLKAMLLPARLLQRAGVYKWLRKTGVMKLLPLQFQKMEQMLPSKGAIWAKDLPARTNPRLGDLLGRAPSLPSPGVPEEGMATIAFFPGCIGSVMFEKVNRQAVELLSAAGCEVVVPKSLGCCGAIHHHNGAWEEAMAMARRNIDAVMPVGSAGPDYIATNIAGCGAMLKDYDHLLRDDPVYAARALAFSKKVRDISEVLLIVGLPEMKHAVDAKVTYHDACHLAHAQKVTSPPRKLLAQIPGVQLVALPESDMCCGAAGTYNLTQPEMSTQLARRKVANIASTGAGVCVTGNVGCAMQIDAQAREEGQKLEVVHPVELLHRAVFGK